MQICGRDFDEQVIQRINAEVAGVSDLTRAALSQRVCDWLGWMDARGQPKQMSARVALSALAKRGLVQLPAPTRARAQTSSVTEPIAGIARVLMDLAELGSVEIKPVAAGDREASRVWRGLMDQYHPLGSGPLVGAQLRYLIVSPQHGFLGALAFSAPAWRLGPRDRFIGWDDAGRTAHLQQVVCNSRFLLLPSVQVKHLASHVLATCLQRLAQDWLARYGYSPVLVETFVDRASHLGTCYRAANWLWVGDSRGRGRQDAAHARARSVKAVYVYPLIRNWRERLGVLGKPEQVLDLQDWVCEEYATVRLGDARLKSRLMNLVRDFYAQPQAQVPEACGSRAKTKAAYRFFDHSSVTMDSLLAPHYESTARRCQGRAIVLALQDSTSLKYSVPADTPGLGPLNTRSDGSVGLWMHDTLALTPDGVPLGLIDVQCWARDGRFEGRPTRHLRATDDKESRKWLHSFAAASALQQQCPGTQVISVGDREADLYAFLAEATATPDCARLLIRAERTRRMTLEHGSLWDFMGSQPEAGIQSLQVPRQGARKSRVAQMSVRHAVVDIKPPKVSKSKPPVRLWAVFSREETPAEGIAPLEWMLLTTAPVNTFDDACERLAWYASRWQIEVYHRTLKSGCKIEDRQLGNADRLESCLAIDMVVAWRVFHAVKLGRETPNVPCTAYFEDDQWRALMAKVTRNPVPPKTPPTLRVAVRLVAELGGFLGRKGDGEPGAQTLWRGLQRLDDLTDMYRVFTQGTGPPRVQRTYG
ncbi:MAG: IS4 family transposase [Ahniella sp.]|nr:IS4 family transposase [Ahniella sp.]